jgi:SnoaL-like domain
VRLVGLALVLALTSRAHAKSAAEDLATLVDAGIDGLMAVDDDTRGVIYTHDAKLSFNADSLIGPAEIGPTIVGAGSLRSHRNRDVAIAIAHDGTSAWLSFTTRIELLVSVHESVVHEYRVSELAVKTANGWRIAAAAWSQPQPNAVIERNAQQGRATAPASLGGDPGDASLREAFTKLTTDGLDTAATRRAVLVAIGSGPGERTTTGRALARPWAALWANKLTIDGKVVAVTAGNTGCVFANVRLDRKRNGASYKTPFRLFFVFEKTSEGWSLVHAHFIVAEPPRIT